MLNDDDPEAKPSKRLSLEELLQKGESAPAVVNRPAPGGTPGGTPGGRVPLDALLMKGERDPHNRPVPFLDVVVRRGQQAVAAAVVATLLVWIAIGDERKGVTHGIWLIPAATLGLAAVVLAFVTLAATVQVFGQVHRTGGRRPGRLRAGLVAGVVVVAVVASCGLLTARSLGALSDQHDLDAAEKKRQETTEKFEEAATGLTESERASLAVLDNLAAAKPGTCFAWPEGPTRSNGLQNEADPSGIRYRRCDQKHGYEVIGAVDAGLGIGDAYPGGGKLVAAAGPRCAQLLLDYLTPRGKPRTASTFYGAYAVAPSRARWATKPKSRLVSCVAIPPNDTVTRTASLAHSG